MRYNSITHEDVTDIKNAQSHRNPPEFNPKLGRWDKAAGCWIPPYRQDNREDLRPDSFSYTPNY